MPALINDLMEAGFFKIRIKLDEAFDAKDAEEVEFAEKWEDHYIDLRELNANEATQFQEDPKAFMDRLDDVIVGHSFETEPGKKASTAKVAEIIKRSSTVYNHVMSEWVQHLPLVKRSAMNSAKLPKT
jgi:hypothetical protein